MTDILIVAATAKEAEFLLKGNQSPSIGKTLPLKGLSRAIRYDLLVTGPGIHQTTWHLAKTLSVKSYDLAINIGIGGSSDANIKPVRVVQVVSDCFAEWGAEDSDGKILDGFELGFASPNEKPFKNGKLHASYKKKLSCLGAIPTSSGITVNTATGTERRKRMFLDMYGSGIESMEGAAFFYSCAMTKTPSLQIRSISNMTGKRNRSAWKIKEAIDALEGFVGLLMMELESKSKK
ncbi:MAG: futalosine hydrolase [Arcticibacter sp.]